MYIKHKVLLLEFLDENIQKMYDNLDPVLNIDFMISPEGFDYKMVNEFYKGKLIFIYYETLPLAVFLHGRTRELHVVVYGSTISNPSTEALWYYKNIISNNSQDIKLYDTQDSVNHYSVDDFYSMRWTTNTDKICLEDDELEPDKLMLYINFMARELGRIYDWVLDYCQRESDDLEAKTQSNNPGIWPEDKAKLWNRYTQEVKLQFPKSYSQQYLYQEDERMTQMITNENLKSC